MSKKYKKFLTAVTAVFLLLFLFICIPSFAGEEEALETLSPDSYIEEILDALPPEAAELLPKGEEGEAVGQADLSYVVSLSLTFLKKALSSMAGYFAFFLSVLLLGALAEKFERAVGGEKGGGPAAWVALLVIALEAFTLLYGLFEMVREYAEKISAYMLTLNGVIASVSVLGGGFGESAVMTTSLSLLVTLIGGLISALLLPIVRLSFASTLSSSASPDTNLRGISSFARSTFLFLIGFLSTAAVVTLSFQTMLAQAEDSVAARGIRFAASSSIPIVGGAVSDSIRTLSAGISLVKRSVGAVGIAGLVVMTLYPLTSLFSARIALSLSGYAASILGVEASRSLLEEVGKLIHMLIATVAMLAMLYIFAVGLFASSAAALA